MRWNQIPPQGRLSRLDLMRIFDLPTRGAVNRMVEAGELPPSSVQWGDGVWIAQDVRAHLRRRQMAGPQGASVVKVSRRG